MTVPFGESEPEDGITRSFLFRQAGLYVAAHSHLLLALWDGGPGTDAACGTSDCVDFALNGKSVIHIYTPRGENCFEPAGSVHNLGAHDVTLDILNKTEDFNLHASKQPESGKTRFPGGAGDDLILSRIEKTGLTAGAVSSHFARKYKLVLALLASVSSVLAFSFLMYDEVNLIWMILVCGLMLIFAYIFQKYAARSDCHRRYIEYRSLAECLRVQTYLRYAGSSVNAAELLSWTQREETAWIMAALNALTVGSHPELSHEILDCWIEDQRKYHNSAAARSRDDLRLSERILRTAMIISISLYLAAVIFELTGGGLIFRPVFRIPNIEVVRIVMKLAIGTVAASTLFISGYYGRFSLPRVLSDHEKMERFFSVMSEKIIKSGQTDEILKTLAREELIENGNWCSYQRDNRPVIDI